MTMTVGSDTCRSPENDANPVVVRECLEEPEPQAAKDFQAAKERLVEIDSKERQPFEVHVTVAEIEDVAPFCRLCEEWTAYAAENVNLTEYGLEASKVVSCKPIIIMLPEGVHRQQPMCSMFVISTLDQAVRWGELFGDFCHRQHALRMVRNKVEARFRNVPDGIPVVRGRAIHENSAIYWEFHVKLAFTQNESRNGERSTQGSHVDLEACIAAFRCLLQASLPCTRLSRSALSSRGHAGWGTTTRIATLRLYEGSKRDAQIHFNRLLDFLAAHSSYFGFSVRGSPEQELSVYDSNVSHDLGWIHMQHASATMP
jgi:hypothetical protein